MALYIYIQTRGYIVKQRLYELFWEIETDVHGFCYREFKVFYSEAEVRHYGEIRETELNGGLSIEMQAQGGYYFKYRGAYQVLKHVAKLILGTRTIAHFNKTKFNCSH